MTDSSQNIRIAILGASSYSGAELVRLLVGHPHVDIILMTGDHKSGLPLESVYPHLTGLGLPDLMSVQEVEWPGLEVDVVFCALPHATSQEIIKGILHETGHGFMDEMIIERPADYANALKGTVKVIDLSADFRLRDTAVYTKWYGEYHQATSLQKEAVYGLTELYREEIANARLVACPGSHPTAALLSLIPLLREKKINKEGIIIDAKSGVSGVDRALGRKNIFTEIAEGLQPYGIAAHRHVPEIEQELSRALGEKLMVTFTPHVLPMNRGELQTIYVSLEEGQTAADLRACLRETYEGEAFVHVVTEGIVPATRHVKGSNQCLIGVYEDRVPGRAILVVAIDNLIKGSAGQAIQNMNIMFGFKETVSLEQAPLFP